VFSIDTEYLEQVCGFVGDVVGWGVVEGVRFQAKGASDAAGSSVACGENVDVGVADHDGFGRKDRAPCDLAGFGDQRLEAVWVGLFGVEAVATVVLEEEA